MCPAYRDSANNQSYSNLLIETNLVSIEQIEVAREEQKICKESLCSILLKMGFIQEESLIQMLAKKFSYEKFQLKNLQNESNFLARQLRSLNAYKYKIVPIKIENEKIHVAFADVLNLPAHDVIYKIFPNCEIIYYVSTEKNIINALDKLYAQNNPGYSLQENHHSQISNDDDNNAFNSELFTYSIINQAIKIHASDIHFEPQESFVQVRFRVSGILQQHKIFHSKIWSMVLSKLKILSNMDIAKTRLPQTGRFSKQINGREVDFRTSCHPTVGGENFVIRILDRLHTFFELEKLGFNTKQTKIIKQQLHKPHGIFILTGPTGSGKTTSLYAMISYLNSSEKNIMTLEDPIEYKISGIRQTQINTNIDLTFANGVKSILRQDPDIILIGEIRDEATANMALRASMTGHLVLTTLHANGALAAINRLIDLGVDAKMLSGNINCIMSQRLIRTQNQDNTNSMCGRHPIAEILPITPTMDGLMVQQKSYYELYKQAIAEGYQTMAMHANQLIKEQLITKKEAEKIIIAEL